MPNAQITIKNTSDKTANPVTFRILFNDYRDDEHKRTFMTK